MRFLSLLAILLTFPSLACTSPAAGPDAGQPPDGGNSGADAARADASGEPGDGLTGRTRIALIHDGVPTVTDGVVSRLVPYSTEPWQSFYAIDLSPSLDALAFCASDDNASIQPFAGKAGAITSLDPTVTRCKGTRLSRDGETNMFIQYGEGLSPAKQIRLLDMQGQSRAGDALYGASQLWTPRFLGDETAAVMIRGGGGATGALVRVELATGDSSVLIEEDVEWEPDVGADDRVAASVRGVLHLVDPSTGEVTPKLDLEERHPDWSMRTVEYPRWGPAQERIAFMSRTGPGGLKTEVLVYDVEDDRVVRITDDQRPDVYPELGAPDADGVQWIYWIRDVQSLVRKRADGTGEIEVLIDGDVLGRFDVEWVEASGEDPS